MPNAHRNYPVNSFVYAIFHGDHFYHCSGPVVCCLLSVARVGTLAEKDDKSLSFRNSM